MKKVLMLLIGCLLLLFPMSWGLANDSLMPVLMDQDTILLAQSDPSDKVTQNVEGEVPEELTEEPTDDLDDDLFDEYDDTAAEEQMVADPIYYFNYAMFNVNDFLYFYAMKPIAQGYGFIIPTPVRSGINNFFYNLLFPVRFVNNIFQGKGSAAGNEFTAFFVNSTVGILGFNNFAQKHMDIKLHDEDLGQTLGSYNIGDGFYIVLPLLGPSTLRDAVGRAGDWFITPINYATPWELSWGLWGTDKINRTSFRIGDYEALKEASLDPYVAIKNAYIQNRRSLIKQ